MVKGDKINKEVTVTGVYQYERPAYTYGYETVHIYRMEDAEGTVYVWKTTSGYMHIILKTVTDEWGNKHEYGEAVEKGDVVTIKATVKGNTEYNGEAQTEVQRVKVVSRSYRAERWDEVQARLEAEKEARKQAQLDSVKGDDFIWTMMPYRQYKEHYSDCETIIDSYTVTQRGEKYIDVIIRADRLKASGVRGKHFRGYELKSDLGTKVVYRAVSEDNAINRAIKEYPNETWECVKVYR